MLQADISIIEIESFDKYCSSGHLAKDVDGKPIRFFQVNTKTLSGTFCENCLILAQFIKKTKKEIK